MQRVQVKFPILGEVRHVGCEPQEAFLRCVQLTKNRRPIHMDRNIRIRRFCETSGFSKNDHWYVDGLDDHDHWPNASCGETLTFHYWSLFVNTLIEVQEPVTS